MSKNGISKKDIIMNIQDNYRQIEKSTVEQLYMKQDLHGTTVGGMREDIWEELFRMVIPKKFIMEKSVFIIDSKGNVSKEVDLAIIDAMYTPYIFHKGRIKFIPIEAVAVVVQCKSKQAKKVDEWCESISKLHTALGSITRVNNKVTVGSGETGGVDTQQSTRPLQILCKLGSNVSADRAKMFDFVIIAKKGAKNRPHLKIEWNKKDFNLWDYFLNLNFYGQEQKQKAKQEKNEKMGKKGLEQYTLDKYEIYDDEGINSLLTFNFQLNQLLMLINNPILFPHMEYVKMFNNKGGELKNE